MKAPVFFSWQSDTPLDQGRTLIDGALRAAILVTQSKPDLVARPELDHDTKGVPGAPGIASTIFEKIDQCGVFVADVSLTFERIAPEPPKLSPNPNVLLELGYAIKRLGHSRVILVQNIDFGGPELLPFDLRGHRVITYSPRGSRGNPTVTEALSADLGEALQLVLEEAGLPTDLLPPATIDLRFEDRDITQDRHAYRLPVYVTNTGEDVLAGWSVEVRFPRRLLEPRLSYPIVRSDTRSVTMRRTEAEHSGPFYPGECKETVGIDYYMDHDLYDDRKQLFAEEVVATFYVGTKKVAQATRLVRDLQKF
jgi:hypothetical protein